jgi:hypothetical protein
MYDDEDEDGSSGNSTLHPIYDMYYDFDVLFGMLLDPLFR